MRTRLLLILSATTWIAAVSLSFILLSDYQNSPGLAATPTSTWPRGSRIPSASDRATLILLAHPKCPCTRASIGELALLMAQCQGLVSAHVLFLKPKGVVANWEKTDLWQSAAAIPGVHVMSDEGGLEARRFHALTSGQTLLFDKDGQLLFNGGITGARAHSGDNAGRSALVSLLTSGTAVQRKTFVFGCSLLDPESQ